MVKTRSQAIKKEEEDCKDHLLLNGVTMTTRSKITKREPSRNRNRPSPVPKVKVEEDADTKLLLKSTSSHSKRAKKQQISQEQINQLIDYIVNDNMSPTKAAPKVKMGRTAAGYYYKLYKNDPEKKVPSPRIHYMNPKKEYTRKDIENLIQYISKDKLSVPNASAKANMTDYMGRYYYNKYLKDPDHNIPVPYLGVRYPQDRKNEFIRYIVNDKMSINAASKKARMGHTAASKYYHKYFDSQNPDIAAPSHITTCKKYTQEQIKELISYIVDDNMTVHAASKRVNMCHVSASNHYHLYLKDKNMEIPMSKHSKRYTQGEIDECIRYIVDDKMTIAAALKRVNIGQVTARKYYHKYLKDSNLVVPTRQFITQEKINELIGYIIDDKMSVTEASKKANMNYQTASRYYQKYIKNGNLDIFTPSNITQDQVNELIGYIVDDGVSIKAASKKSKYEL